MELVDLGVAEGRAYDGDGRVAVVLPGAHYLPGFPLLWFVREALQQRGWGVLEVWAEVEDGADRGAWVAELARAALARTEDASARLLVAKSISSLAAGLPEAAALPAIWLTPLLNLDEVLTALRRRSVRDLVVGGSEDDPHWIGSAARSLPRAEVLEIPGADHALQLPGDPDGTLAALARVVAPCAASRPSDGARVRLRTGRRRAAAAAGARSGRRSPPSRC